MLERFILSRPKGVKRKMVLPKGVHRVGMVTTMMLSSSYQLVVRLFLGHGSCYATRSILDAGSGPTVIRKQILLRGLNFQHLGGLERTQYYDLNGGWLSLVGSVTLGTLVGDQVSHTSFGVVSNMAVPVVQGNSWTDFERKIISTVDQTVTLKKGDVVPIQRGHRKSPTAKPHRDMVCACPRGDIATPRLARKAYLHPGTQVHVPVSGGFEGNGFITGRAALHTEFGVQVAEGRAHFRAGKTKTMQMINGTNRMVRLPVGTAVAHVPVHDGVINTVTPEEIDALEKDHEATLSERPTNLS